MDLHGSRLFSVDPVLGLSTEPYLSRDGHRGAGFVADRRLGRIVIVEDKRDNGLLHTGLSLFVDQFGQVTRSDLTEVGDSEDEADRIENVGLSGPVQAGDGVEVGIKAAEGKVRKSNDGKQHEMESSQVVEGTFYDTNSPINDRALRIRLEAVDNDFFNVHDGLLKLRTMERLM